MTNLIGKTIQFASDHKKGLGVVMLAGVAPLLIPSIPDAYEYARSLPDQLQYAIAAAGTAATVGAGAAAAQPAGRVIDSARRRTGELVQRQREADANRKNARLRKEAFIGKGLPGADKVVMLEKSAGNISNVGLEPSTLHPALQEELAAAKRGVAVIGDTSPGLELDAMPDLLVKDHDQYLAVFKKSPVRDDIQDAIRRTSRMWLPRQEPKLHNFLKSCEVQVSFQIAAPGCTSLTDSLYGFGAQTRGSEANFQIYVHDPREEAVLNHEDSADLANGHREQAEVPSLVAAGGVPDDLVLVIDPTSTSRPGPLQERSVDHRSFEEQLLTLETEFFKQAGYSGDRVLLISNFNGMKQNSVIRRTIDILESASLRNYYPLGSGPSRSIWPDYADVSHVVAGSWQPSVPMTFGDSHAALVTAKEIASGQWESQYYGYTPEVPLELRKRATTFVTGNPRAGLAFIEALEGALQLNHTFITHWNERSPAAYSVFCVPVYEHEIKSAGLRCPSQVFTKQVG